MLPNPPRIELELVGKDERNEQPQFLRIERNQYVAHYPNGDKSEPFWHDTVIRKRPDAVIILPYFVQKGTLFIYLRSSIRPSLVNRFVEGGGNMWELPAGIIDPGEAPEETAARELMEEAGFEATEEDMVPLGTPCFTSVGTMAELMYFYCVQVDPNRQKTPSEDGSALEKGAVVAATCIESIRCMISRGLIPDMKTELAIRRIEKLWHVGAV